MEDEKINRDRLREKAEKSLEYQFKPVKDPTDDQYIHELRVHKIELEMQNEELREAQIKLEDSQGKYFDLYNLAPDGYFTLDKDGIIIEANLKGAT